MNSDNNCNSDPDSIRTEGCATSRQPVQPAAYAPPALTRFGAVSVLTGNGGGSSSDGSGNSMTITMGSDTELKTNVVRIGTHPSGIGLYLFDYKPQFRHHGADRQFGVMAQEVEQVMPEAVSFGGDGYRQVNYTMLGISLAKH